jgi:(p)ppGpp synthase/HD superfamily hydrolase
LIRTHLNLRHPEEIIMVGWPPDVTEQCDVTDETIRSRFGDLVADGVDTMTRRTEVIAGTTRACSSA